MITHRILVIGGYGFFGTRLVHLLSRQPGLHILIGGRSVSQAQTLAQQLRPGAASQLEAQAIDIASPSLAATWTALRIDTVVHTAGPFQDQDYHVAQACIGAGAHYIDLADGRDFVAGIGALHAAAANAGVLVTSGASSVPALSSAVADTLAAGMARVTEIDIGISPGNRTETGSVTWGRTRGPCTCASPACITMARRCRGAGRWWPRRATGLSCPRWPLRRWRGAWLPGSRSSLGRALVSACFPSTISNAGPQA